MPYPPRSTSQRRRLGSRTLTVVLALFATAAGCFGTPARLTSGDPAPGVDDQRPPVTHDLFADATRHVTAR